MIYTKDNVVGLVLRQFNKYSYIVIGVEYYLPGAGEHLSLKNLSNDRVKLLLFDFNQSRIDSISLQKLNDWINQPDQPWEVINE